MIRTRILAVLLASLAATNVLEAAERALGHSLGAPVPPIGKQLQPVWSAISREARIFLVAGGRDSANFAQEIVDQKKYWLDHGYKANQIECFFAAPPPEQDDDAEQFLSLEEGLRDCHLAAPGIIFAAISELAQDYEEDFFYLYVSSHGTDPPLKQDLSARARRGAVATWYIEAQAEAKANPQSAAWQWFAPYRMEVEGAGDSTSWGSISFSQRYLNSRQGAGPRVEDQLFTPKYLAQALQKFPPRVRKIVVLQACHSGGFLLPADEAPAPDETLVNVSNITVLAAARADRTSFGCDTSDHTTYYGGALQEVLDSSKKKKIPAHDWHRIHKEISDKVEKLEADQKIPSARRSLPQYYSNDSRSK